VLFCSEALHYARVASIPIVFLQIDFRKAYDKVSWRFLSDLFAALQFSPRFQLMLQAITYGTQSQLLVNGVRGQPFDLNQSVRQGCPLSPILFAFAMHTLSCAILAEQNAGKLRGLALPDSIE
jgi:hypothetical protein